MTNDRSDTASSDMGVDVAALVADTRNIVDQYTGHSLRFPGSRRRVLMLCDAVENAQHLLDAKERELGEARELIGTHVHVAGDEGTGYCPMAEQLQAKIEAVRELHQPAVFSENHRKHKDELDGIACDCDDYCDCGNELPCPTIAALNADA